MRQRELLAAVLLLALSASACSRLTFVRPDASRGRSEQVAPVYDFRDDDRSRPKVSPRTQLLRAQQQLEANDLDAAEASAPRRMKADSSPRAYPCGGGGGRRARVRRPSAHARPPSCRGNPVPCSALRSWLATTARGRVDFMFHRAPPDSAYANRPPRSPTPASARPAPASTAASDATARGAQLDPGMRARGCAGRRVVPQRCFMSAGFSEAAACTTHARGALRAQIEENLGRQRRFRTLCRRRSTEFRRRHPSVRGNADAPDLADIIRIRAWLGHRLSARIAAGWLRMSRRAAVPVRVWSPPGGEAWSRLEAPLFVRGQRRSYGACWAGAQALHAESASRSNLPRCPSFVPPLKRMADRPGASVRRVTLIAFGLLATRPHLVAGGDFGAARHARPTSRARVPACPAPPPTHRASVSPWPRARNAPRRPAPGVLHFTRDSG